MCYIPPTNSSSQSHRENDAFDNLILDMAKFKDMYRDAIFLVCGDMNGRTGNAPDHLVNDSSSYLPLPDNLVEDTELWRVNEDHIINTQGRNILDMCKMCDLRILNGMCGADKGHGRFTFIPCSVLILASDWLTIVKYGAISHVWRYQREI